ncbi:MAG: lysophospholipid acyltransferase family protein [Woeseiaceae bacterium]|nr:lysophospholipid acyltransferase family protein [Woeseiaceae bacterium]
MLARLATLLLKLGGWTAVGDRPDVTRAVIIAAPHTSNWDAVWGLIYKVSLDIDVHFFGKHTVFWFPLGTLLRALGGIPLDRSRPGSAVQQVVDTFRASESFYFALAPEGTRRRTSGWKSGFYRIARDADVPVICGFLDFGRKRIGLGPTITLSGDVDADLARFREFYADIEGRHPELASPVRFESPPQ